MSERDRLNRLNSYEILDTAPEGAFDRLVRLAAELFDAPIALINFVDEDRQWFKARVGTDLTETSRELSFCAHAILGRDLLVVPDATKDARFADNPWVDRPDGVRFLSLIHI